jgi:hypothetical protein
VQQHVFAADFGTGASVSWTLNGQTAKADASIARCAASVLTGVGGERVTAPKHVADSGDVECRPPTPNEVAYPGSSLPPAARENTCVSINYDYLGTYGFKWRGLEPGEQDLKAEEAEIRVGLLPDEPIVPSAKQIQVPKGSADSQVEVSQRYFSIGKFVRKCVKKVAGAVKKTMDLVEQGLLQAARLFVGSREVEVEIVLKNTDVDLTPTSGATDMVQPWGGLGVGFGEGLKLKGMSVRAAKSVFLSKGTLSDYNKAKVRVLNRVGADICFTVSNDAAELVSGWFIPHEVCNFVPPNGGGYHIGDDGKNVYTLPVQANFINVLAQATNARKYMKDVAGVDIAKAEIITGAIAQIIGDRNSNRAFAPCLALNGGVLSVYDLAVAAAGITGQIAGSWVLNELSSKVNMDTGAAGKVKAKLQGSEDSMIAVIAELAAKFPGQDVTTRANAADTATKDAKKDADTFLKDMQALDRAQQASYKAKQAADAAVGKPDENKRKAEAVAAAETVKTAAGVAQTSGSTALAKVTDAWNKFGDLYTAMNAVPVSQAVKDGVGSAYKDAADAKSILQDTAGDVEKVIAKAAEAATGIAAGVVWFAAAMTFGEVFELFASGDIILPESIPFRCDANPKPPTKSVCPAGKGTVAECPAPSGLCYRSSDSAGFPTGKQVSNPDPRYRMSVKGRGVATHEYGHYTLCNLLAKELGDSAFRSAYGEAAMAAVLSPDDASIQALYVNDGFADFFTSEVIGGTGYPRLPTSRPNNPRGGTNYCAGGSFASDLEWGSSTNGFGPAERDYSNGEAASGDGRTITLGGTTYSKGIGVHAPSEIVISLNGAATQFAADIGVDDEVGNAGSVTFEVWADGAKLYGSPTLTGATATAQVNLNITGKSQLRLVVTDGGDGNTADHADWANASVSLEMAVWRTTWALQVLPIPTIQPRQATWTRLLEW